MDIAEDNSTLEYSHEYVQYITPCRNVSYDSMSNYSYVKFVNL